jgi:hypothetical protein
MGLFRKSDPILDLENYWERQRYDHGPPSAPDDIATLELRYGVCVPDDLRRYFVVLNGGDHGADGTIDNEMITFWNLSQFRPASEEFPELSFPDASRWFIFADYMIASHFYAIRLSSSRSDATPVAVLYDNSPVIVADSFSSFVTSYLKGDWSVLVPNPS